MFKFRGAGNFTVMMVFSINGENKGEFA